MNYSEISNQIRHFLENDICNNIAGEIPDKWTRRVMKEQLESYLFELYSRNALYDYHVVCDETNNSIRDIERGQLNLDIFLKDILHFGHNRISCSYYSKENKYKVNLPDYLFEIE